MVETPLQGFPRRGGDYPGRGPGLVYFAPLGLGIALGGQTNRAPRGGLDATASNCPPWISSNPGSASSWVSEPTAWLVHRNRFQPSRLHRAPGRILRPERSRHPPQSPRHSSPAPKAEVQADACGLKSATGRPLDRPERRRIAVKLIAVPMGDKEAKAFHLERIWRL
jgi:hypothetical protein